jgi:hypothetical protein
MEIASVFISFLQPKASRFLPPITFFLPAGFLPLSLELDFLQ